MTEWPAQVAELAKLATAAAEEHGDRLAMLATIIREAPMDGTDCRQLLGVLLEGIVFTLAQAVPKDQQAATKLAVLSMLLSRLDAYGI